MEYSKKVVTFTAVCCYGSSLQYTHMNEKEIPDVLLRIFTLNARSVNPKMKQIASSGVDTVNTVGSYLNSRAISRRVG